LNIKPGKHVGEWIERLKEWQLIHPNATKQDAIDWMTLK
jgi:hypothetical protein